MDLESIALASAGSLFIFVLVKDYEEKILSKSIVFGTLGSFLYLGGYFTCKNNPTVNLLIPISAIFIMGSSLAFFDKDTLRLNYRRFRLRESD